MNSNSSHFTSKYDYPEILARVIEHCGGVGVEVRMSSKRMADELPTSKAVVADLRKVSARVGALATRYEGGPKKGTGRHAYWTFTHDATWVEEQAMEQFGIVLNAYDIEKKMPKDYRYNQTTRTRPHTADDAPPLDPDNDPRPTDLVIGVMDDETIIADKGGPLETEFSVKMKAAGITRKKSDAEALVEAARQYMGREAFIIEELKRFADMGITIDASAIHVKKDEGLEAASHLVAYIDTLASIIDRQADSLEKVQQTGANAEKVEQLRAELAEARDETRKVRHAYEEYQSTARTKTNTKDHQIQRLRREVEDLATKNLQHTAGLQA